ncbi:MAG: magnesium transporter [Pseudomonadota bacterium]
MAMFEPELLQSVHAALDHHDEAKIRDLLEDAHPSEIADLLEALPIHEREEIWDLIEPAKDGEVLAYLEANVRPELIDDMAPAEFLSATEGLDTDDVVDILQDLPEERIEEMLASMEAQRREHLAAILSYPEDSAGGLMDTSALTIRADVSLEVIFRYLRRQDEFPDKTDMLLVVDRHNHLMGGLFLSDLLTSPTNLMVEEVMFSDIEGIPADMSAHDVTILFERKDWVSAPVIDKDSGLLGRITIDDVVDVIRSEADQSLLRQGGVDQEEDTFERVTKVARRRAFWLGINLLTAFLAAWVIGLFEQTLEQVVALAVLMPIVASMGGIAGTQTLTIMIRGIALGKIDSANAWWLLRKELLVGILNGLLWAFVVGIVAGFWFDQPMIGVVLAVALLINLCCAALSGTLIPLLLKRLSIDPALAGGVVLTTVTDVVGFFTFLGLGAMVLL